MATDEQITIAKSLALNPCYLTVRDREALAAVLAENAALRKLADAVEAARSHHAHNLTDDPLKSWFDEEERLIAEVDAALAEARK